MRRLFIIALLSVLSSLAFDSSAQIVVKKRIGTFREGGNVVVAEANTMLAVDFTVSVEHFQAGPYARYAERMLGCSARMSDNVAYRILSSNIAVVDTDAYLHADPVTHPAEAEDMFPALLPDRMDVDGSDAEKRAKAAAEQIFTLRTTRLELITAELGDGVYGAGLESALREIERLEREYTELFLGRKTTTTQTFRYFVPVTKAEFEKIEPAVVEPGVDPATIPLPEPKMLPQSHIVARFSEHLGMLPTNDQRGDIILVTINPQDTAYPESNLKGRAEYRYANNSKVTLSRMDKVLVERILPVYEYGCTVKILEPAK